MESPYFPIALNQMPGNISVQELKEMRFSVGAVSVEACRTNHPGVCVAFRLSTSGGSIVYMPDNETFSSSRCADPAPEPVIAEDQLLAFLRDADLLICDAQYTAEEYGAHVGWGHGCVDEVVRLAIAANVRRLFLFHHDPAHDDQFLMRMLSHARALAHQAGSAMLVEAAREGEQVALSMATA
jgi:phosphoribosyl 1,2-cyclic phosphodiesterase